ncbi:high affinity immunoglobulin epsilon receptor subunit gamma-like [Astyanax mexicanus]|uniref:High affinity immunoglobulin epsilon receptor subunit gamma-like n=2 Tax=Astyanax mexicanus TaxID=7994 RepID=A0A8B9RD59_ASTMX|nr:high affinity immunoglobulin epsilon receptor subunit gamma-like [Astyanax mexicanus]
MKRPGFSIFSLFPLWMTFGSAAALDEPKICYVLDAVLFIYGVVLTVLYCRMKLLNENAKNSSYIKKDEGEGVYEGLAPHAEDPYETIQMKKKKTVA